MNAMIGPIHHSIRRALSKGRRVRPNDMTSLELSCATRDTLAKIALGIFADSVNVGVSFQDALLAIYVSGLQHGGELTKETIAGATEK